VQELAQAQHGVRQHDELEQQRQVLRQLHARRLQHLAAEKHKRNEEAVRGKGSGGRRADVVRTMATPARFGRRPDDGDVAAAAAEEGGSTSGGLLLFRLATAAASHGAAAPLLLGLAAAVVEQFRRRCTSLLCRGFTMKSSAPALRHLHSEQAGETSVLGTSTIACSAGCRIG